MGFAYEDLPARIKQLVDSPADSPAVATRAKARPQEVAMNKTEQRYAGHLEALKQAGEIIDWKREPFNIRLADGCFYKPDFAVVTADGYIEIHEVKGYWRDDALVKIKAAAEALPWFLFKSVRLTKNNWTQRTFNE